MGLSRPSRLGDTAKVLCVQLQPSFSVGPLFPLRDESRTAVSFRCRILNIGLRYTRHQASQRPIVKNGINFSKTFTRGDSVARCAQALVVVVM